MKLRKVKPELIKIPEVRVTSQWDPETYEQFQAYYREAGQVALILCVQVGEDLVLVDGYHRLMEAITNRWPTIEVGVVPGDMVDVLTRNLMIDHLRGKHPPSEMRQVIDALFKEYKLGIEDIVKKSGLKRDYVEKLILISELTPFCLRALDEQRITVGHAAALTKLKDPVREEMVLQQLLTYRWTVKELEEYIRDVLAIVEQRPEPGQPAPSQEPIKVKCRCCGHEHDPMELAAIILCRECSSMLFTTQAEMRRLEEAEAKAPPKA